MIVQNKKGITKVQIPNSSWIHGNISVWTKVLDLCCYPYRNVASMAENITLTWRQRFNIKRRRTMSVFFFYVFRQFIARLLLHSSGLQAILLLLKSPGNKWPGLYNHSVTPCHLQFHFIAWIIDPRQYRDKSILSTSLQFSLTKPWR